MRLPRFTFQALMFAVMLIGVVLAAWDYALTRRREIEIRDKYEQLLRSMEIDSLYLRDVFLRVDTLKAVVDKHGLTAEADDLWDAAKHKERASLREHGYNR